MKKLGLLATSIASMSLVVGLSGTANAATGSPFIYSWFECHWQAAKYLNHPGVTDAYCIKGANGKYAVVVVR